MFGSRQKLKYLVSFSSVDCYDSNFSCYCLLRTKFVHLKVKKADLLNKEKRLCLEYYLAITNGIHGKQFVVFRLSNFCLNGYTLRFHSQTPS